MPWANRLILAAPDSPKASDLREREQQTLRVLLTFADLAIEFGRHSPLCPLTWPGVSRFHRCKCRWGRRLREAMAALDAVEARFLDDFGMRPVLMDGPEFSGLIERTDDGSDKKRK